MQCVRLRALVIIIEIAGQLGGDKYGISAELPTFSIGYFSSHLAIFGGTEPWLVFSLSALVSKPFVYSKSLCTPSKTWKHATVFTPTLGSYFGAALVNTRL